MGNSSPGRGIAMRGAGRLVLVGLVAVLLVLAGSAYAHGGEKHRLAAPEAPVPAAPAPTAHPSEGHDHAEVHPEAGMHAAAEVHAEAGASAPAHAYPPEGVPRALAWLGIFHPLFTHFPIALLTVAALAELLLIRRPQEIFRHAVRFCVWAIGAVASAPLGWFFAGFRFVDDEWVMTAHRWAGTASAFWALGILYVVERVERGETGGARTGLRAALFAGALGVGATGFLGGALIYGLDHYAW